MPEQSGHHQSVIQQLKGQHRLRAEADLSACNTFGVAARSAWLAEIREEGELPAVMAMQPGLRHLVMGGGSNLLFITDFAGVVVRMVSRGRAVTPFDGEQDRISVAAGENWDAFVRWSLAQGYCGLENLILIPGSVGAAPIQNIGAYGVEVAEFIEAVRVWDREREGFRELAAADCGFAYRDSLFKRQRDRYIVTRVDFRLPRRGALRLDYAGIREELSARGVQAPTAGDVAVAVEALRRRKLPDPAEIGNAGSFFKNPVVSTEEAGQLAARHPGLPVFELGAGRCKLSAAWLIEACGLKGWRQGAAGISERHALVLVNHGGATGAELWAVAETVQAAVRQRFGVALEPEPRVVR